MSQSIDLGNVDSATFNGAVVEKINLNGSLIWEEFSSYSIRVNRKSWGDVPKITGPGYASGYVADTKAKEDAHHGCNYFVYYDMIGVSVDRAMLMTPTTFKGYHVGSISWNKNMTYLTLTLMTPSTLLPMDFIEYLKIGNQTFYATNAVDGRGNTAGSTIDPRAAGHSAWAWVVAADPFPASGQYVTIGIK